MAPHTPNETRPSLTALLIGLASLTLALASNASAEHILGLTWGQLAQLDPTPASWFLFEEDGVTQMNTESAYVSARAGKAVLDHVGLLVLPDGLRRFVSINVQPLGFTDGSTLIYWWSKR